MRVVYLADAPYIHTVRWVEHFARTGWETHVISFRPAEIAGAQVHYVGGFEKLGKLRYLIHSGRVRRLVRKLQPDLLHAMHLTSYGYLAARSDVHPTLTSVWGTDILEAPDWSPFHSYLTRAALVGADHVTATGPRLANATLRYAPGGKPVTVVPYGVDLARFQQPARKGARPGPVVVGAVARLSKEKGLDVLLEAVALLATEDLTLRIILAGDGPERAKLEALAGRLGLAEQIEFRGEVLHKDVPLVLAEVDIFAMPSRAEGFGVAALEAQAMEVPVVGSEVDGIPDVVDSGRTGLLVPPGDAEALARAIERLACDVPRRAEMGRSGRAFVAERYRWEDNVAQMERLYSHLVGAFHHGAARGTVA